LERPPRTLLTLGPKMASQLLEYTNLSWECTKQYMSGFRMPDWKKLWYSPDDVDSDKESTKPLLVQFEAYLIKVQELSLWINPKNSVAALAIVHFIYWYLSLTANSPLYLLSMVATVSFVYTTWTQRIWPEIRVAEANPGSEPEWTPVNPDVLSAPDILRLWEDAKFRISQSFAWLQTLRQAEPGKFCALLSTVFLLLAYVGSCMTTLGLFYYVSVGYLTIPGLLKILVKYPAVQCMLETMEDFKKQPAAAATAVVIAEPAEETLAPSLAESVYATLQSGLNAVSNLNLKSDMAVIKGDDDLYLPEEDETNQIILESAMNSSTRDPTQAHCLDHEEVADSSLEYASLLPVAAGDLMPDDELDNSVATAGNGDDDEFLPSESQQSRSLTKLEDDDEDEFTASLMAAAARDSNLSPSTVISPRPHTKRISPESDDNMDDFEMISEEELAEVSP